MSAFDEVSLWNKAKVFIDRALRARDNDDVEQFHLWGTIALELIGKAALANVHPSLVADPTHQASLLAACGRATSPNVKSINAKTVYDRLRAIAPRFDERMSNECLLMANRRNAELHSRETPTIGLDARLWVPFFWKAVEVLVSRLGKTLADLVGIEEATRLSEVLRDSAELTRQTVTARIARRRAELESRYGAGTSEWREAAARAAARPVPSRFQNQADTFEEADCPACEMKGWVFGSFREEEIIEAEQDADPEWGPVYVEIVEITYDVEQFRCSECGLILEGREEVELGGLPLEFKREDEREPDYEPEYGNE